MSNAAGYAFSRVYELSHPLYEQIKEEGLDSISEHPKYDGCYFSHDMYPDGRDYLAVFDSLDCKIARYFGYGPDVNVATIFMLIFSALFMGPIGAVIFVMSFIMLFVIVSFAARVLYVFIMSFFVMNVLIFTSPIIFPALLFKTTKNIFDGWFSNLVSVLLQPMLLAVYTAFALTVLENHAIGDATFTHSEDNPREVILNCSGEARFNSLLCLVAIDDTTEVSTFNSFNPIGIVLKFYNIADILPRNVDTGIDLGSNIASVFDALLTLLKSILIFALLFLIFTNIADGFVEIMAQLTGGQAIVGGSMSVTSMASNTFGVVKQVGRTGSNIVTNAGSDAVSGVMSVARGGDQRGANSKDRNSDNKDSQSSDDKDSKSSDRDKTADSSPAVVVKPKDNDN